MNINEKINNYQIIDSVNLIILHDNLSKCYVIIKDSTKYIVFISENSEIKYISTHDLNFKTYEGIGVQSNYSDILNLGIFTYERWRGWGTLVSLDSGWIAVFNHSEKLTKESKIQFFIKYDKTFTSWDNLPKNSYKYNFKTKKMYKYNFKIK